MDFWRARINEHLNVIELLAEDEKLLRTMQEIADEMIKMYKSGGKLLICGNGGSAADSQHIATELVSRFLQERAALDAEALTVNTSSLTAIGNDYNFEKIFARQVEAKGRQGDMLLAISTSGNSNNVIEAIKTARVNGMRTISLIGDNRESTMYKMSEYCICVPSRATPRIQEAHILIGHMLCEIVEKELFPSNIIA